MKHSRENSSKPLPEFSQSIDASSRVSEKRRRPYGEKYIPLGVRLALGVVFIYASIDKIFHPAAFAEAVYNYQVLPDSFVNFTAIVLPWLELFVGMCLILGVWLSGAVLLSTVLLTTFFGALLFNVIRGLNIDCGCFSRTNGTISDISMLWYLLRDGAFLILALYLFTHIFLGKRNVLSSKEKTDSAGNRTHR